MPNTTLIIIKSQLIAGVIFNSELPIGFNMRFGAMKDLLNNDYSFQLLLVVFCFTSLIWHFKLAQS